MYQARPGSKSLGRIGGIELKLSIIIPYYNTQQYTEELLNVLDKQMTSDVEVILIDDESIRPFEGDYKWLTNRRINHGGQSKARNVGLDMARGEYVQFIDSDDLVADCFIEKLMEKIPDGNELIEFSWRSLNLNGKKFNYRLNNGFRIPNPSVCTRCFKRSYIGYTRFNELKDAAEDEDFTRRLGIFEKTVNVSIIPELMYFYRTDVAGSNAKRYKNGECNTKRILYYFKEVTHDRLDILTAVSVDARMHEVILMTYRNEIPELRKYCQIISPSSDIWTHYQKGEPFRCNIIRREQEGG